MKKLLGVAIALLLLAGSSFAQEKADTQKPAAAPKPAKVEDAAKKAAADDCCAGEKVKEKAEGCGEGCGDCADMPKSTGKAKSSAGAAKGKHAAMKPAKAPGSK